MANPPRRIAGQRPPVPGVDFKPLKAPTHTGPRIAGTGSSGSRGPTTTRTKQYSDNLHLIEEQQRKYQEETLAAQAAEEKARKKKAPLWAKALGYGATALQY